MGNGHGNGIAPIYGKLLHRNMHHTTPTAATRITPLCNGTCHYPAAVRFFKGKCDDTTIMI